MFSKMDQRPKIRIGEWMNSPVQESQFTRQINEHFNLATKSTVDIEPIHSVQNQSCLPPPPDYYDSHLIDYSKASTSKSNHGNNVNKNSNLKHQTSGTPNNSTLSENKAKVEFKYKYVNTELKYLCKWSANAKRIKLQEDSTSMQVIELNGTLLTNDRLKILNMNHEAGRLEFILSKNVIKTNNGLYYLIGPIAKGSPNNLYRACLEINGIPKTWKYILTQFSAKPAGLNKSLMYREDTCINSLLHNILMKGYRLIQKLLLITLHKLKQLSAARKPISFVRYNFHQKLIQSIKIVNDQLAKNMKPLINQH